MAKKRKEKKIVEYARSLGIKLKVDKSLGEKYKDKILFPEQLAKANEILSKMDKPLPS